MINIKRIKEILIKKFENADPEIYKLFDGFGVTKVSEIIDMYNDDAEDLFHDIENYESDIENGLAQDDFIDPAAETSDMEDSYDKDNYKEMMDNYHSVEPDKDKDPSWWHESFKLNSILKLLECEIYEDTDFEKGESYEKFKEPSVITNWAKASNIAEDRGWWSDIFKDENGFRPRNLSDEELADWFNRNYELHGKTLVKINEGFRFKKRIKVLPGINLNLSKGGASVSIGPRGADINIGKNGVTGNVGIPGTGISYREKLGGTDLDQRLKDDNQKLEDDIKNLEESKSGRFMGKFNDYMSKVLSILAREGIDEKEPNLRLVMDCFVLRKNSRECAKEYMDTLNPPNDNIDNLSNMEDVDAEYELQEKKKNKHEEDIVVKNEDPTQHMIRTKEKSLDESINTLFTETEGASNLFKKALSLYCGPNAIPLEVQEKKYKGFYIWSFFRKIKKVRLKDPLKYKNIEFRDIPSDQKIDFITTFSQAITNADLEYEKETPRFTPDEGGRNAAIGEVEEKINEILLSEIDDEPISEANSLLEKMTITAPDDEHDFAVLVARAYYKAPKFDPAATKCWDSLLVSSKNYYQKLLSNIDIVYVDKEVYPDAAAMKADVKKNHRMYVSLEYTGHPYWSDKDYQIFRAVHDYIVHVEGDSDFTLHGEQRAANLHMKLVPHEARPAAFLEIIGKTSYALTYGHFPPSKIAILKGFDFNNIGQLTADAETGKEPFVLKGDQKQMDNQYEDLDPGEVPAGYDPETETIKHESKKMKNKKQLNETSLSLPSPINFMRYEDDDVVANIKKIFEKSDYSDFTLDRIQSMNNSQYNIEITYTRDSEKEDIGHSFELNQSIIVQRIHKLRSQLFADMSSEIPVVNANIAAVQKVKNSDIVKFVIVLLCSATNNRDWVTGKSKITKGSLDNEGR